jgi:RNA polymerase sigma-70 factor (ECF subfamily)
MFAVRSAGPDTTWGKLPRDADAAVRQLYTQLDQVLDRQLVCAALQHLSPAHRMVLVETFYGDGTPATVARRLGIPPGTARSRLHYALHAPRQQLQDQYAAAC